MEGKNLIKQKSQVIEEQEWKKFISKWDKLLASLQRGIEKNMISYIDSDLAGMARLIRQYRRFLSKEKYDEIMECLNAAVKFIWGTPGWQEAIARLKIKRIPWG